MTLRPGPLRLTLENRTDTRLLPGLWIAGDKLHDLLGRRRPFLTAKRLLTNQVFRDIYGTDTIDVEQRLKITSLTFLFTDLKGSTELYERVGDLVAFDLVREHFRVLNDRQDYFGTTVNIAARVQGLADSRTILATRSVVADPQASALLETSGLKPVSQSRALRGIADEVAVYEIP